MNFEPIETQEQFEAMIRSRLERNREQILREVENGKYSDYEQLRASLTDAQAKLAELGNALNESTNTISAKDATIADLEAQISAHVTNTAKMRIAQEYGLELSLANRLNGTTEDEIRADAEALKAVIGSPVVTVPLASTEPQNDENAPYRALLKGMKGE